MAVMAEAKARGSEGGRQREEENGLALEHCNKLEQEVIQSERHTP